MELSTGAVVLILVGTSFVTYVLTWAPPGVHGPMAAAARLVAVDAIRLALWLVVIGALAWWRPCGLGTGWRSLWGIVPFAVFGIAAFLGANLEAVPNGNGFLALLIGSDLLGALREEVAFRGFLLHGLTRRLGGARAVVIGSLLFALVHVPRYLREGRPPREMVALLLIAFGVGVFLCRVRVETGSIWFPAGIHALWNVVVGVGGWSTPHGQLSGALTALHAIPFALGILMFVILALPRPDPSARSIA